MNPLKIDADIRRIDLERQGNHVFASFWRKGWQEGCFTDICQYLVDTRIEDCLFQCEQAGFTVWMADRDTGRALRGETTRIDFVNGEIKKYPFGWSAKTPPIQRRQASPEEIAQAIQWCRENGWTVMEWPGGSRAFKGPARPVRDTSTIQYLRHQIQPGDPRRQYDLAFYF